METFSVRSSATVTAPYERFGRSAKNSKDGTAAAATGISRTNEESKHSSVNQPQQQQVVVSDILSRSAIYTPLKAYSQTAVEPSAYLKQFRNVPKSMHESSIPDFYQDISIHYHHHHPSIGLDGKNTSAKPMNKQEVSKQMESRAVTLVGGGFYAKSPATNSSTPLVSKSQSTSLFVAADSQNTVHSSRNDRLVGLQLRQHIKRCKRKRIKQQHKNKSTDNGMNDNTSQLISPASCQRNSNFVKTLNDKWNAYAWRIISMMIHQNMNDSKPSNKKKKNDKVAKTNNTSNQDVDMDVVEAVLSSPTNRSRLENYLEWVGARVRIQECLAQIGYQNKEGIVVACTTETWKIFIDNDRKNHHQQHQSDTKNATTTTTTTTTRQQKSIIFVPKKGTSLLVLLPVVGPSNTSQSNEEAEEDLDKKSKLTSNKISAKVLCIVLKDFRQADNSV